VSLPKLTGLNLSPASESDKSRGLLGFIRFRYGDLLVDGVTLRRTQDGRLTLSYPARRTRSGAEYSFIRPVDDRARRELDAVVFATLGLSEGTA